MFKATFILMERNFIKYVNQLTTFITFPDLTTKISEWKSKGLSNEKLTPPDTVNKSISSKLIWNESKIRWNFDGSSLKQEDKAFFYSKKCDKFIYCLSIRQMDTKLKYWFHSENYLFSAVKLTNNADPDNYKYSNYGLGFD